MFFRYSLSSIIAIALNDSSKNATENHFGVVNLLKLKGFGVGIIVATHYRYLKKSGVRDSHLTLCLTPT